MHPDTTRRLSPPPKSCPDPKPCSEPCSVTRPVAKHILTPLEASDITNKAIELRVNHLPNPTIQRDKLGKTQSLMLPRTYAKTHPAFDLLEEYAQSGCPVDCGPDWSLDQIMEAISYGSHPSAKDPIALQCLIDETNGKVTNGFARKVKWKEIQHNIPPKLKLSPVAMIPHKSRAFRCILDLSFTLKVSKTASVNDTTVKMAPAAAMDELGSALKRIINQINDCQTAGRKVKFAKLDIKDGFWRLVVHENDAWNFCYILPPPSADTPLEELELVVPNCLQMGWCESPPFFCAASETARDVISSLIGTPLPPHPFETRMLPTDFAALPLHDLHSICTLVEVFVDDFIACTDNLSQTHLQNVSRAMLHGIHSIFPPPNVTGHKGGDPISEKKLDKLEGLWDFVKEILGWMIDGANFTIELPPSKVAKITDLLRDTRKKKFLPLKEFQKLAGTLHHASTGIPGGRGLFTTLWMALKTVKHKTITMSKELHATLDDFKWLFQQIANNPVNVAQLVPSLPTSHGYTDACKHGAGGVWILSIKGHMHFILWAVDFPPDLVADLDNQRISINDLEMAGVLLGWLALEYFIPDMAHHHVGIQCDNSSTVHWSRKFTARSMVAGHLLRALALRQQVRRSAPLLVTAIAGEDNKMADVASRFSSDKTLNASSPNLLSYFNSTFPQASSWKEFRIPPRLTSRVISSLRGERLTLESWRRIPKPGPNTGVTGLVTQPQSTSTPSSKTLTPSSGTQSSQLSLLGSGQATTAKAVRSKFKRSLKHFQPSARPSNWLASKAQSTEPMESTPLPSSDALKACDDKTPPLYPN